MLYDARLLSRVNLDGTIFGPIITRGFWGPFLIFGHEGHNLSTEPTWASIWPHLCMKKLEITLKGAEHGIFTDLPLLAEVHGLTDQLPSEVLGLTGTLSGTRAIEGITSYLVAFLIHFWSPNCRLYFKDRVQHSQRLNLSLEVGGSEYGIG
jgi:hypothetical protein